METLVLNQSYMPINCIPWYEALGDLLTGRAEVVETYADVSIRTGVVLDVPKNIEPLRTDEDGVWLVPSIIRFVTKAVFGRRKVKFNRHNVWLRDKGRCQYCNTKLQVEEFTFEHIQPQSRGGLTMWENIVVACVPCNHKKANRTPREAGMRLIRPPVQPHHMPGHVSPTLRWREGMPDSWKSFLESVAYWHGSMD